MALEPITRQEKIIAGQDLTPITRMEKFLKQYGGGSGGVTSWNELEGKPFVTVGGDTLEWDGNTEGLEYNEVLGMYRIADSAPTVDDLNNAGNMSGGVGFIGSDSVQEFAHADIFYEEAGGVIRLAAAGGLQAFLFPEDFDAEGIVAQKGVYTTVFGEDEEAFYLKSLTIPGYTGFTKEQIDPAVLPESPIVIVGADDTMKLDKTLAEIQALRAAGKTVLVMGSHISVHSNGDTGEIIEGAIVMFDATTTGSDTNVTGVALTAQVIKFAPDGSCIGMGAAEVPTEFMFWQPLV